MTDNPIFAGPRHRIRRWRNYGMGMGFGVGIEFLFQDDFITAEAAPLTSPRTAEPGPGIGTFIQIDGDFSIGVGLLTTTGQGTPIWGDLGFYGDVQTRAAGLGLFGKININDVTFTMGVGWKEDADVNLSAAGGNRWVTFFSADTILIATDVAGGRVVGVPVDATDYELAIIARDTGAFHLIKGGVFTEWTMLWVLETAMNATVYPAYGFRDASGSMDYMRVSQLPSPWDTDYGIATDRLAGARGFGDQFVHEADFLGEFIQTTVPTAGFTSFQFRRQSVNNYWSVVVEPSTDLSLFEVVAGVPTLRGIAVGVVGNGDRIVVIANGPTIRVYEQNTLRITYALAANFQTETDGSLLALGVGGAVSDIVTWPRVLSGTALRALDRVADA